MVPTDRANKLGEYHMAETVVITGASSGVGLEMARLFAQDGATPILVARREKTLEQLAGELRQRFGVEPQIVPLDLADPASPQLLFDTLQARGLEVDVLVNNAGFGQVGKFAKLPLERQLDMVQVNVTTLTALTRLFLPAMLARGRGGVLNVGSTAGFQPGPGMAVYYATKAFVLSFSQALAEELASTPVRVTCLAPGATQTEFMGISGLDRTLLLKFGAMGVQPVALVGYRAFRAGKVLAVPGWPNKLLTALVPFMPRLLVRKLVKRLNS
jgi:short-subunit dehydrogenase